MACIYIYIMCIYIYISVMFYSSPNVQPRFPLKVVGYWIMSSWHLRVAPAPGGAEAALGLYDWSFFIYRTCMHQPDFLHTSCCSLHTSHFTLHTCTSQSTLHLISPHLSSCHLISPHLSSSQVIPSLLTCHLSNFPSTVFISSKHWSTFLISSKFFSTHCSSSPCRKNSQRQR